MSLLLGIHHDRVAKSLFANDENRNLVVDSITGLAHANFRRVDIAQKLTNANPRARAYNRAHHKSKKPEQSQKGQSLAS